MGSTAPSRAELRNLFPCQLAAEPGLRLTVTDHAGHDEAGIVQRRAERVRQRVTELAALVDGAGYFGCDVAGYASRNENWRNSLCMPSASRDTSGVTSLYVPSNQVFANSAGPP